MSLPILRPVQFRGLDVRCTGPRRDLWFVAQDVGEALGMTWKGIDTLEGIPEDWRRVRTVRPSRRKPDGGANMALPDVILINEAALYKLDDRFRNPPPVSGQAYRDRT